MSSRISFATQLRRIFSTAFMLFSLSFPLLVGTPINNYQDPVIFHTVMGSDKYFNPTGKAGFALHISPFYQHTHSANTPSGTKTSNGNVFGTWNMAGLFLNDAPRPTAQNFAFYNQTKTFLRNLKNDPATNPYSKDYTNEALFNPDEDAYNALTYHDVSLRYEKLGLRGQINFDLGIGLGMNVKGGVVNMKNRPDNFALQQAFGQNAGLLPAGDSGAAPSDAAKAQALGIYERVLGANARRQLFKEIGLDASEYDVTDLEDLYANIYWHVPIKIKEHGEHVFSLVPHLSVGASLPMGKERDYNKLFGVINGNDGYAGLTAEGAIALDFPAMMQLSFGGGVTMYNTRDLVGYHVPTSDFQSGLYPWRTSVSRQPGPLWYANISMKADDIMSKKDVPNFSVYFDYIYAQHMHDVIKLKEPNAALAGAFKPELLQRDSSWRAQVLHGGIKCGLSKNVYLTFSAQGTISGARTYRPTTLLGGLIMSF